MALIKCPECGNEVSDKAGNCPRCGFPIYLKVNEGFDRIKCSYCGTDNENYQTKCSNCGASLGELGEKNEEVPIKKESIPKPLDISYKTERMKDKGSAKGVLTTIFLVLYFPVGLVMMWAWKIFKKKTRIIITSIAAFILLIYIMSGGSNKESAKEEILNKQPVITVSKEEEQNAPESIPNTESEPLIDKGEVYNGNNVIISINDVDEGDSSTTFEFVVENLSDKDYSVSAHTYSVNGLMAGSNMYGSDVDVPAGKKAKFSIDIGNDWISENGINNISKIDIIFWGYYDLSREWDSGIVEIKTNSYSDNSQYLAAGSEVYSDDAVSLWLLGEESNQLTFAIKNTSAYNTSYEIENCSVNGWSYDISDYTHDLYNEPIHSESYDIFTISVDSGFMKDNNIDKVENVEFNVSISDDYWYFEGELWKHNTEKIYVESKL